MKTASLASLLFVLSTLGGAHGQLPDSVPVSPNENLAFEQAALTQAGDAQAGRKLFFDEQRGRCSVCHHIGDQGGLVGPELTSIGGKFDRPHLIESLLEPSRQIVEGYRTTHFLMNSGQVISGIVKRRTDSHAYGVDAAGKEFDVELSQSLTRRRQSRPTR